MNHNDSLIQSIRNKFSLEIIKQFGINGGSDFFMISQIGEKLKELFNKFNDEYKKLSNNDLDADYYLLGIRRKLYLQENHQILDDKLKELLEDNNNVDLINSFNDVIDYINSLHYIDIENDFNNDFLERYDSYLKMCNEPNNYEEYEFDDAILFFEELKNNFRGRNQQAFKFYNNLQEKYYQILELNFGVKYDNIPDNWN